MTALTAGEIAERTGLAVQPAHWSTLCPSLNIGGTNTSSAAPLAGVTHGGDVVLADALRQRGHVQIDRAVPVAAARRLAEAAVQLKRAGWPPVFLAVYDEFWNLWRVPAVQTLLSACIGPDVRMRPRIWCYYVHAVRGARGWPPHADDFGRPGLSVWIPLTDSTIENGCMYVVSKDLAPSIAREHALFDRPVVDLSTATELLQCARPLPADAGSVLAWTFDVIHWGGIAQSSASEPRISVSAEFVPAGAGYDDLLPPWNVDDGSPAFEHRLRIIGVNLQRFAPNDAWSARYAPLGLELTRAITR